MDDPDITKPCPHCGEEHTVTMGLIESRTRIDCTRCGYRWIPRKPYVLRRPVPKRVSAPRKVAFQTRAQIISGLREQEERLQKALAETRTMLDALSGGHDEI